MIRALSGFSYWLDKVCRTASCGFLATMLILVLFQVVARYIFQGVPVWTEELARWCMVWGGLLGATVAFKVDADPRLLQPPTKGSRVWIFSAFWLRSIATVIFLGPVLWHSDKFIARLMHRIAEAVEIPLGYVSLAVPIMVTVIFIHLAVRIIESKGGLEPAAPGSIGSD